MTSNTLVKTIYQYSRLPVSSEDMRRLQDIADDYSRVKNYVFQRYGGVGSLPKLYPGYTVQNEMTRSGLREDIGLPSVFFYLAVFDALGCIKSQWTRTKQLALRNVAAHQHFTEQEKHYLRFVMRCSNVFIAVLSEKQAEKLPAAIDRQYEELSAKVDVRKLNRYLCRQVRKYHVRQHSTTADGFAVSEKGYRYADGGIYLSTKEKRRRIFVALTDNNRYHSQIYVKLCPETESIELHVPIEVRTRKHEDYCSQIGVSIGMHTMLTTQEGHKYGEELGMRSAEYADWVRRQTISYNCNKKNNPGRKKYHARKKRMEEQLHSYINQELNRFLKTEKPEIVYVARLPRPGAESGNKKSRYYMAMWQRGYIRSRLLQKCREHSVEVSEVLGKGISSVCSCCAQNGSREKGLFHCVSCGYSAEEKTNTARNVLQRGVAGQIVY